MIKLLFPKIILENPRSLIKRSVESERVELWRKNEKLHSFFFIEYKAIFWRQETRYRNIGDFFIKETIFMFLL